MNTFIALTGSAIVLGAIYALVALGYTLVYGVLRLINFAHSEIWMWGSFAAVWVLTAVGASRGQGPLAIIGLLLLALVAAMLTSGAVALLVERVAYRRLRRVNAPPLIALISAIGASFCLGEIMGLRDKIVGWIGLRDTLDAYVRGARDNTRFPNPVASSPLFHIGNYGVTNIDVIIVVSALVMMVVLDQFIRRSRLGRGIRAVAQDAESAALMGVNKDRVIQITFLLGGIMAGGAARDVPHEDRRHALERRLLDRAQGVHGGSARRHRQRARRPHRRVRARARRELRLGHHRHPVEGRRRVRPAGGDPAVPTYRSAR